MKQVIWSLIVNVSMAAFVWLGFFQGIEGAQHVVKFYVWAMCFPLSFLLFTDKMQEGLSKIPKIAFTEMLSRVVAWFSLGAFVWHGYIATAVIEFLRPRWEHMQKLWAPLSSSAMTINPESPKE